MTWCGLVLESHSSTALTSRGPTLESQSLDRMIPSSQNGRKRASIMFAWSHSTTVAPRALKSETTASGTALV